MCVCVEEHIVKNAKLIKSSSSFKFGNFFDWVGGLGGNRLFLKDKNV